MTLAGIKRWALDQKLFVAVALAATALVIASAAYRKPKAPQPEQPKVEQPVEQPKAVKKHKPKASKRRHVQQPSQPSWRRGCDANGQCWWYWG